MFGIEKNGLNAYENKIVKWKLDIININSIGKHFLRSKKTPLVYKVVRGELLGFFFLLNLEVLCEV